MLLVGGQNHPSYFLKLVKLRIAYYYRLRLCVVHFLTHLVRHTGLAEGHQLNRLAKDILSEEALLFGEESDQYCLGLLELSEEALVFWEESDQYCLGILEEMEQALERLKAFSP